MASKTSIIFGSIVIFFGFLFFVYVGTWASQQSKQTEKNFADAIRVLQGDK